MTRALAVGAAVAVAAVALGGCTSSGGTPTASSPAPSATPPLTVASSPAPASASSAPKTPPPAPTSIRALQPLSCATLPSALGRFHRGGFEPSGMPVPQAVPAFTCTGARGAVAVAWRSVTEAQYTQELTGTGWTRTGPTYRKPGAPRTIALRTLQHTLVAIYRPS